MQDEKRASRSLKLKILMYFIAFAGIIVFQLTGIIQHEGKPLFFVIHPTLAKFDDNECNGWLGYTLYYLSLFTLITFAIVFTLSYLAYK